MDADKAWDLEQQCTEILNRLGIKEDEIDSMRKNPLRDDH